MGEGAKGLAKDIFNGFEDQANEDALAFARKTENDLKRWTEQLALKQIDREEFGDFIKAGSHRNAGAHPGGYCANQA